MSETTNDSNSLETGDAAVVEWFRSMFSTENVQDAMEGALDAGRQCEEEGEERRRKAAAANEAGIVATAETAATRGFEQGAREARDAVYQAIDDQPPAPKPKDRIEDSAPTPPTQTPQANEPKKMGLVERLRAFVRGDDLDEQDSLTTSSESNTDADSSGAKKPGFVKGFISRLKGNNEKSNDGNDGNDSNNGNNQPPRTPLGPKENDPMDDARHNLARIIGENGSVKNLKNNDEYQAALKEYNRLLQEARDELTDSEEVKEYIAGVLAEKRLPNEEVELNKVTFRQKEQQYAFNQLIQEGITEDSGLNYELRRLTELSKQYGEQHQSQSRLGRIAKKVGAMPVVGKVTGFMSRNRLLTTAGFTGLAVATPVLSGAALGVGLLAGGLVMARAGAAHASSSASRFLQKFINSKENKHMNTANTLGENMMTDVVNEVVRRDRMSKALGYTAVILPAVIGGTKMMGVGMPTIGMPSLPEVSMNDLSHQGMFNRFVNIGGNILDSVNSFDGDGGGISDAPTRAPDLLLNPDSTVEEALASTGDGTPADSPDIGVEEAPVAEDLSVEVQPSNGVTQTFKNIIETNYGEVIANEITPEQYKAAYENSIVEIMNHNGPELFYLDAPTGEIRLQHPGSTIVIPHEVVAKLDSMGEEIARGIEQAEAYANNAEGFASEAPAVETAPIITTVSDSHDLHTSLDVSEVPVSERTQAAQSFTEQSVDSFINYWSETLNDSIQLDANMRAAIAEHLLNSSFVQDQINNPMVSSFKLTDVEIADSFIVTCGQQVFESNPLEVAYTG